MTSELAKDSAGSRDGSNLGQKVRQFLFPAPLERGALVLVIFLFSADALFIGFDALIRALRFIGFDLAGRGLVFFNIQRDGGIPETFNYFQLGLVSIVLVLIYHRSRVPTYLILALIFAYALFDDALQLHEQLGVVLAAALVLPDLWGVSGRDIAQPLYFAIVAGVFAPMLLGGWFYANPTHRRFSISIIALFCALAFFAVFVDFVHVFVANYSRIANQALALVEDGGEMLVVTLSCWVALSIHSYAGQGRT